jgi:hypothetical protein
MSLFDIDENRRTVTIVGSTKQAIQFNWGFSHTIADTTFCLVVPFGNPLVCASTLYSTDARLHLSNGIYNATLCRKNDIMDEDILIDCLF